MIPIDRGEGEGSKAAEIVAAGAKNLHSPARCGLAAAFLFQRVARLAGFLLSLLPVIKEER